MARNGQKARFACGTALMAVGATALACIALGLALLAFMKGAATGAERDPASSLRTAEAPTRSQSQEDLGPGGVDWRSWCAVNGQIVAWIRVPGTPIDYPVVQASASDPRFYLSHDVFGNANPYGCPYVDAACESGIDSPNVVIYGHNMGDDAMFGGLVRYRDPNWARDHRIVELSTPEGVRTLTVCGADTIEGTSALKQVDFQDRDELGAFAAKTIGACATPIGSAVENPRRMYTLCTCSYFMAPANERTLVYAFETDE